MLAIGLSALAAGIVLAVLGVASPRTMRRRLAAKVAALEAYGRTTVSSGPEDQATDGLPPLLARLRAVATVLSPSTVTTSLARRLDVAGNPASWTVEKVLAAKGLGLFATAAVGLLLGLSSPVSALGFAGLGGLAGFFLPDLLLYNTGGKRQAVIRKELPDTLDMLTVCVEAGLGFDAAVAQVGHETKGPLAAEFLRMLHETQLGQSRVETLRALADRTTVAELRAFASALVQAAELGVPTGRVLREQAKEMRVKQRQLAEEKAQKLPVKILFPLMFCIFPALFVVVLGPAAISMFQSFQ
ncbi:type II secretion system F family protein [Actinophytocola sp.]|uniref:type II secretion system F family protein n=1 Tax=Actinophytocola sp. TaxID=1872138 RepID=UPI002ED1F588